MYISDAGTNALCTVQKQSCANFSKIGLKGIPSKYLQNTNVNIFATLERDISHLYNAFITAFTFLKKYF